MNSGVSRDVLECSQGHQDDIPIPFQPGSGSGHFRAQIHRPGTVSDLINFVSFGHLFCQDLDLAILLHQDVHLAQTELYQMDLLDGIACAILVKWPTLW